MSILFENRGLRELLGNFLEDPFVKEQKFHELNLEEIGNFFEAQQEELHSDLQGFERAKSQYCLILLELELLGYTTPPKEPLEIYYRQINGPQEQKELVSYDLPDLYNLNKEINLEDLVMPGGGHLEASASKEKSWTDLLSRIQSPTAKAYYELGRTFTFSGSFPRSLRKEDLDRIYAQCQIWSIECELFYRLKNCLVSFWSQRDTHISHVLYQQGHAYDFHPDLKRGLESIAREHPEWMFEKKFPVAGIMSSLRYMLSVPSLEKFVPACIDFASLLLLFGRNAEYGAQLLYNILNIQEVSSTEVLELSARLCRLQRLKAKILNPHQTLSPEVVTGVREDSAVVFLILLRIEVHEGGASQKVVA